VLIGTINRKYPKVFLGIYVFLEGFVYLQQISASVEPGAALAGQPLDRPDAEGHVVVVVAHLSRSGQSQWSSHRPARAMGEVQVLLVQVAGFPFPFRLRKSQLPARTMINR